MGACLLSKITNSVFQISYIPSKSDLFLIPSQGTPYKSFKKFETLNFFTLFQRFLHGVPWEEIKINQMFMEEMVFCRKQKFLCHVYSDNETSQNL